MDVPRWPTFGETLQYLRNLGFTVGAGHPGYVYCRHPDDDASFVFRDRDPTGPARETELLSLKSQLTYRGFVTDDEYARFWNRSTKPMPAAFGSSG